MVSVVVLPVVSVVVLPVVSVVVLPVVSVVVLPVVSVVGTVMFSAIVFRLTIEASFSCSIFTNVIVGQCRLFGVD